MENLNIAEILKDCPKGMKLDCTMWDICTFEGIEDVGHINILIQTPNGQIKLSKEGCFSHNCSGAKCVIFPKGKTTWEGFQRPFKDGDIVSSFDGKLIGITKGGNYGRLNPVHCIIDSSDRFHANIEEKWIFHRLSTEEEKQKLFDAIKANGYKWNAATRNLEKLVKPKFKVGDRIKSVISSSYYTVVDIKKNNYFIKSDNEKYPYQVSFEHEISYQLVPNKFDITTLKPFSKVLVRDANDRLWKPTLFGFFSEDVSFPFTVIGGNCFRQCIPYDGNEHLLGTTDDCDEFYKTWE